MFLEARPEYTDTYLDHKEDKFMIFEQFVQKYENVFGYSDTEYKVSVIYPQTNYSSEMEIPNTVPKLNPTPLHLKKAMFKTSSKGIAQALNRGK